MTLYCDRSPLSVDKATTVARAYEIFTKLGLRHLVVKGHTGKAEGMLTRKDLMLWRISAFKEKELNWIKKIQSTARRTLKSSGFYDRSTTSKETKKRAAAAEKRLSGSGISPE